ncbi:MAG: helix-turn-helix transcriptional regulator [Bacteroidetes bacterium]|nr:helix-turn-helix transcriptional regulator [Bacteroidota bacterium]
MIVFITPTKAKIALAENMRERRLALNLTQAGLSERSGVALGTLRKFEQSGAISIDNLLKLMLVVGGLRKIVEASAPDQETFSSIDDVLSGNSRPMRKRGSHS